MSKITFVVGLPGSGKSEYLKSNMTDDQKLIDDYKADAYNGSSKFIDSKHYQELLNALKANIDCFVVDIDFCRLDSRQEAVTVLNLNIPNITIEWIFFENNPTQCELNAIKRGRESLANDLKAIRKYTIDYNIPAGSDPIPIPEA